jgi:hypothetical protein
MIDHLTNDMRQYEQVCLNLRDIQELRLIELPSTFHESKAKLRAIDPCLVDIRLSPSDDYETRSISSTNDCQLRKPIARQSVGSYDSDRRSALISSSSNESSLSFGIRSNERYTAEESNDESVDEHLDNIRPLKIEHIESKPMTLLAKKTLPKRIDRSTTNNAMPSDQREPVSNSSTHMSYQHATKKMSINPANGRLSPIRVTITSKLNPHATPFYVQQRVHSTTSPTSLTFYEQPNFRARLPPILPTDRSQSLPYGMNRSTHFETGRIQHPVFVPPRQMVLRKGNTSVQASQVSQPTMPTSIPVANYIVTSSSLPEKRSHLSQSTRQRPTGFQQQPTGKCFVIESIVD